MGEQHDYFTRVIHGWLNGDEDFIPFFIPLGWMVREMQQADRSSQGTRAEAVLTITKQVEATHFLPRQSFTLSHRWRSDSPNHMRMQREIEMTPINKCRERIDVLSAILMQSHMASPHSQPWCRR